MSQNKGRSYQWAADGTRIKSRKPRPFTLQDHQRDAATAIKSPFRRCPDCASLDWTIVEGVAVCRKCHAEMRIDNQPNNCPR